MDLKDFEPTGLSEREIKLARRERIHAFELQMMEQENVILGDSDSNPLKHKFSGNIYVREIFIPKGVLIVGKIHRHSHPNFLMKGKVSVFTEENGYQYLEAPLSMITPKGVKRLVYAHEDTIWITIHEVGEERDLEKIEDLVISKTYEELEEKELITSGVNI